MIPTEIPKRLREAALVPDFAGKYDAVWTADAAFEVLESLDGTKVAVTRAQGCARAGDGLLPTNDVWVLSDLAGETESQRARRSHASAMRFLRGLAENGLVMLEFSYQDDAA